MVHKPKLKVFRTAIGFDDAYVATPSRKAALAAWGADKDLFARGLAEPVSDPALSEAPLASPGTVIRRRRGTLAEHLSEAGKVTPPSPRAPRERPDPVAKQNRGASPARPKPRPSRDALSAAEAALAALDADMEAAETDLRRREVALRNEREALRTKARARRATLERRAAQAREGYDRALERWRAED